MNSVKIFVLCLGLYSISCLGYNKNVDLIYKKIIKANNFVFYPYVRIIDDENIEAYRVPFKIIILTGMLAFIKNDHELAWVLGHELAHAKLGHKHSTYSNEYAADQKAMEYIEKAGFNKCIGAKILLRANVPASFDHASSLVRYNRIKCRSLK